MKLSPFGESVRILRMKLGLTLKSMADALEVSSAHLSAIEFGDKTLLKKHIDATLIYFTANGVDESEIAKIESAAQRSSTSVAVKSLNNENKELVAAFARKLEGGYEVPKELAEWVKSIK